MIHDPRLCVTCHDLRQAVIRGEVTCIHSWADRPGGMVCSLCTVRRARLHRT